MVFLSSDRPMRLPCRSQVVVAVRDGESHAFANLKRQCKQIMTNQGPMLNIYV